MCRGLGMPRMRQTSPHVQLEAVACVASADNMCNSSQPQNLLRRSCTACWPCQADKQVG